MRNSSRFKLAAGLLLIGLALAFLLAANGPSKLIPCGGGNFLDRLAASIGHALGGGTVDSATGGACREEVPRAGTWALSLTLATVSLALPIFVLTRRRNSP
jgi:hypothetical protein